MAKYIKFPKNPAIISATNDVQLSSYITHFLNS